VGRRHYARTPRRHRHRQVRHLRATPACSPAPGSTPTTAPSTPSLSGDILGDWREEVIWPTSDNTALRIYSTPYPTNTRITTILHATPYRTALAWQNTAYNQPPAPQLLHRRQHAYATPPHRRAAEQSLSWTAVCGSGWAGPAGSEGPVPPRPDAVRGPRRPSPRSTWFRRSLFQACVVRV
jgi:hypothetical protein